MRTGMQKGFTLIEMIVVIVITGIIAGIVAIFIQAPVQGYTDSARRAELTDIADSAVRRMARDVRMAVPNSARLCGAACVEYVQANDGGRYRSDTPGNPLVFDNADTAFDVLGTVAVAANDHVVIGSSESNGSVVYGLDGLRKVSAYAAPQITLSAGLSSFREMPSHRFDVVDAAQGAVTYACEGVGTNSSGTGTGVLRRYWGYWDFSAARLVWSTPASGGAAILVDKLSACTLTYDAANQRFGLLTVRMTVMQENEGVTLYHQMHVNNLP